MRRALALLSVALTGLLAAAPGAAAETRHGFELWLHADGFLVDLRSPLGGARVRLLLDRHGEVAYYYTKVKFGAGSVRARFGRLGALALRFDPGRGEDACGGGEEGWRQGTFRGSLLFRGEHDYADLDVRRARGWLQTYPSACGSAGGGAHVEARQVRRLAASPPAAARRPSVLAQAFAAAGPSAQVAETGAVLEAATSSRYPARVFWSEIENRPQGVRASFNALREERREGMVIDRGAQVYGGESRFRWNLGAGTARLEPPAPFSGRAFYSGGKGRPPSWRGSLRAPVLGGSPMRLAGPGFEALLGADT